MSDKKINDKNLEKVSGGRAWDSSVEIRRGNVFDMLSTYPQRLRSKYGKAKDDTESKNDGVGKPLI